MKGGIVLSSPNALNLLIKKDEFLQYFSQNKNKLYNAIEKRVKEDIEKMSVMHILTLVLKQNGEVVKTIKPGANKEYATVLIHFLQKKYYSSHEVDSYLTPIIMRTVEECILQYYSSKESIRVISNIFEKELKTVQSQIKVKKGALGGFSKTKYLSNNLKNEMLSSATDRFAPDIIANLSTILAKTSSTTIMFIIAKVLSSTAVISILKPILFKVLSTISLSVLIKTAIGKALLALLGIAGAAAGIPVVWILIPLIAAFLTYEISNLPTKMAKAMPEQVIKSLDAEFGSMNRMIVNEMIKELSYEIEKEMLVN